MPGHSPVLPDPRSGILRTVRDRAPCYCPAMSESRFARTGQWVAIGVAVVALALGVTTLAVGRFQTGIRLSQASDGRVVVLSMDDHGVAWDSGIRPGMIVTELNGVTLIELPHFIYDPKPPTPDPNTGEEFAPAVIGVEPTAPFDAPIDATSLQALIDSQMTDIQAIQPWDLERGKPDEWPVVAVSDFGFGAIQSTTASVFLGTAVLVLMGWWLASGRAGSGLRPLAIPLATATAVPFLVRPLAASSIPVLIALGGLLVVVAMLPLADALIERIEDEGERRLVIMVSAACAAAAALLAIAVAVPQPWQDTGFARWALVGAIPLIPGLAAAGPMRSGGFSAASVSSGRLLESTEFAVVGATPLFAVATDSSPYLFPLVLWLWFVLAAGRFTIRPLARLATRATLQRDLVVAATEAERARVAADIHDDALQELTLLVHRLDAAGDAEGAEIARTVSDRLRAICGDLRLPILDDLGVGPALDWLVLRIERLAGGEVRLERSDGTRPPANVELAFFRVAQEALSNAVKHGKPPIVVRYSTSTAGASLSIDDAGPGIEPGAGDAAESDGHFGLINMQQRAEGIGAILDVRRWPAGGTHVKLDWRAH